MRTKVIAPLTTIALSGAMLFGMSAPAVQAAPPPSASAQQLAGVTAPITQVIDGLGTFTGTFTPTQFNNQNGQLTVNGLLNGTLKDASGNVLATVTNLAFTNVPVTAAQATGSCQILHLDLGPLDLNLLGVQVHLNEVVLDITAVPGPGNLLGNLLCAVAGLLDGNATGGLANLLNRLLGL
ncbi:ABC transporter substrate-binding protein [Paenarthrobacter sp. S56]|uniref:ABC transporter substrate-binding protein n=1 Tax=Paenarthrobacter sp. S56 TaxID=3138179 RepID=UPI0032192DE8